MIPLSERLLFSNHKIFWVDLAYPYKEKFNGCDFLKLYAIIRHLISLEKLSEPKIDFEYLQKKTNLSFEQVKQRVIWASQQLNDVLLIQWIE